MRPGAPGIAVWSWSSSDTDARHRDGLAALRAAEARVANVQFIVGDIASLTRPQSVDVVVGRLVLMYLPDSAAVLRHLMTSVAHGGVFAFQESDVQGATSEPRCPLFEATVDRLRQTFDKGGIGVRTGLYLGRIFESLAPKSMVGACLRGLSAICQVTCNLRNAPCQPPRLASW